jgi:uncharacterized repeat protein (TIGR01451 family)
MTESIPTVDIMIWPRWYRMVVIGLAVCVLCSCRAAQIPPQRGSLATVAQRTAAAGVPSAAPTATLSAADTRPPSATAAVTPTVWTDDSMPAAADEAAAWTTEAGDMLDAVPDTSPASDPSAFVAGPCAQPCARACVPRCPQCAVLSAPIGAWRPPGIAAPWPAAEYLCDGGDLGALAKVRSDGTIGPLQLEETLARYETDDGRVLVTPSNRVCVYAPRFSAVRRVDNPVLYKAADAPIAVEFPQQLDMHERRALATTALQRIEPRGQLSTRGGSVYRLRQQGGGLETRIRLAAANVALMPYEDLDMIRLGRYDQNEKPRLAQAVVAAITWTHRQAVQVILDGQRAVAATTDRQVATVYRVDTPDNPRLRICKIASTSTAKPGETVDFTIRYDNVGDQTITRVTLLDNLTTRLELVPDTSQSSAKCEFSTEANDGSSLLLRWDLHEPLKPGEGGIVRFRCKVR